MTAPTPKPPKAAPEPAGDASETAPEAAEKTTDAGAAPTAEDAPETPAPARPGDISDAGAEVEPGGEPAVTSPAEHPVENTPKPAAKPVPAGLDGVVATLRPGGKAARPGARRAGQPGHPGANGPKQSQNQNQNQGQKRGPNQGPNQGQNRKRGPQQGRGAAGNAAKGARAPAPQPTPHPTPAPAPAPGGGQAPGAQVPAVVEPPKPPAPQPKPKPADKKPIPVPPTVPTARPRGRHWVALLSFMLMVVAPVSLAGWYLWERAADQYASFVGFSVRTEEKGSAIELLGNVTDLSGSSSSDTDILYEFLQSQELVAAIDASLDLRRIWSRADPAVDPIFSYHPPGTIEDLVDHWDRMVKIYYDSGTGLIDLRVLAFAPEDATAVAGEIYDRSSAMINELSAVAREDAIGYAREELSQAEDRLKQARVAIQAFRNRTQIIDPTIQTQTQSGLIGALETQLAEAQIELRLLRETARASDPRIKQTELKIEVIEQQISAERAELGLEGENGNTSVADLVSEYEEMAVDLEFAQQAYTAARATFDAARNEARRQSRYLAAHVQPTRAEAAKYPERGSILALITLFLFLFWAVALLAAYALRDRR